MNKWEADDGYYKFKIVESDDTFDLYVDSPFNDERLWFPSYRSARNHLKREYGFEGRMKKVL
ncbi:hypothetical protein BK721_17205 [Bacillus thuringiensis serovar nigeriensis]|uniref:hypothetical protein n=1 Tax=Bacillus thuringiensis TaxID=1428 RepID=UPI000A3C352C|nr:hypothetical protein [Bacillus thuringiensis]MRC96662.1 hypothetical protein [Bacillus thuringiensis]OTX18004.1 hypothetical protein BK721_17205 [Bacillus thuringiensis serovar nigeriensis]